MIYITEVYSKPRVPLCVRSSGEIRAQMMSLTTYRKYVSKSRFYIRKVGALLKRCCSRTYKAFFKSKNRGPIIHIGVVTQHNTQGRLFVLKSGGIFIFFFLPSKMVHSWLIMLC